MAATKSAPIGHGGSGDPAEVGLWEPVRYRFRHLPVHMALLPTGKVLAFGGSCNDDRRLKTPYPTEIWDSANEETTVVEQNLAGDVFCVGHCHLPDGRLLAAGGTHGYDGKVLGVPFPPFAGLDQTYAFDPFTEAWTRVDDLAHGRWYPTLLTLGDGRVLAVAGLTKRFPWAFLNKLEIYTPGMGWEELDRADRWLPLYPRLHLLPNGEVFYAGSYNTHYTFPFSLRGFPTAILDIETPQWRTIGLPNTSQREEGATVLLPLTPPDYQAMVLLMGGGTPGGQFAVSHVELIDLSHPDPGWEQVQPMQHARYYVYAVLLPDRNVLVVGGRSGRKGHLPPDHGDGHARAMTQDGSVPQDPQAVREAELFDPATREWRSLASMAVDRLYHSNALLLPDGRVLVAGSNPHRRMDELRIEIYQPPYLFRGPRPQIEAAPAVVAYGETFAIKSPQAGSIDDVALIRLSATTHCLNTDQRYVGLPFTFQTPDTIHAEMPPNPNLAPPGVYMLFILDGGVPSEAAFVRLG